MTERQKGDTQEPHKAPPARAADPQKPGQPLKPGPQEDTGTDTEVSGAAPTKGDDRGPDDRG